MATAARLQAFVASRARQPAAIRCSLAAPQKPQRAHASAPRTRSVKVAAKNAVRRIDEEDGSVVFQFNEEGEMSKAIATKVVKEPVELPAVAAVPLAVTPAAPTPAAAAPEPEAPVSEPGFKAKASAASAVAGHVARLPPGAVCMVKSTSSTTTEMVSSTTTTTSASFSSSSSSNSASFTVASSTVAASSSVSSADISLKSSVDVNSLIVPIQFDMPDLPPVEGDAQQRINALVKRAEMEAEAKGRAVPTARKSAESASGNLQKTVQKKVQAEESEVRQVIALREMEEQRWTMDAAAQETWRSSLDAATRKEVSGALTRAETIFKSAAPAEKNAYAEQLAALIAQGEQKQMAEKRTVEEWAMSVTRSATEAKSNAETALKAKEEFDAAVNAVFEEARAKRKTDDK